MKMLQYTLPFSEYVRFIELVSSCQSSRVAKRLRKQKESEHSVNLPTSDLLMYLIALKRSSKKLL